jgi:hypothetical protein
MKVSALGITDYLAWLKEQEEYIRYCLTFDDQYIGGDREEYERELQVVKDLQKLVGGKAN